MKKPNCYKCHWKKDLLGSCNVKCSHPLLLNETADENQFTMIMSALLSVRYIPFSLSGNNPIGVVGDQHGIKNGWFNFPYNYDPVWLIKCQGFREK